MADIIKSPDYEKLVSIVQELEDTLAGLVHERDTLLFHTCPIIKTEYMLKIGKIEYAIFNWQCKILRAIRKMALIQAFINRGEPYSIAEIEKQLDREYQEYIDKLLEKQKEIDWARMNISADRQLLTKEEASELKQLYIQIVKRLHPDINPNSTEEQHAQFADAVNAYKNADLPELRIIFLLLDKIAGTEIYSKDTIEKLNDRKEKLLQENNHLLDLIQNIKQTFPYNMKDILSARVKLQEEIDELTAVLLEYQEKYKDIENRLNTIMGLNI